MVGKLARLAEGANWVHHLLSHVYTSIAAALAKNVALLKDSSQEFKDIIHTIRTWAFTVASKDQSKHVAFAYDAKRDWIFPGTIEPWLKNPLGNAYCTPHPSYSNSNCIWRQFPRRCRRILTWIGFLVAYCLPWWYCQTYTTPLKEQQRWKTDIYQCTRIPHSHYQLLCLVTHNPYHFVYKWSISSHTQYDR